jgi:hypothetical protein
MPEVVLGGDLDRSLIDSQTFAVARKGFIATPPEFALEYRSRTFVPFEVLSGLKSDIARCPRSAITGLVHRNK